MTLRWQPFQTRVPGKWVLAGEHSVLKGVTAVAMPHQKIGLTLTFEPVVTGEAQSGHSLLRVEPPDAGALIQEILTAVSEQGHLAASSWAWPEGRLRIESSIPIGAGFGSSAALCVALTRWMAPSLGLSSSQWLEFATTLEHRFHGVSSGMDVAVITAGQAVAFEKAKGVRPLGIQKLPHFTFHDTAMRSRTRDCVNRVEKFRADSPSVAQKVDESMAQASELAMTGLKQFDAGQEQEGIESLARAIQQAQECFYAWELVPGQVHRMEKKLLALGAQAVKLTGAGGGGMLVALWRDSAAADSALKSTVG
ncbi:MAG: mevalonate kinase family protein [Bdellovibrionia bacterium]